MRRYQIIFAMLAMLAFVVAGSRGGGEAKGTASLAESGAQSAPQTEQYAGFVTAGAEEVERAFGKVRESYVPRNNAEQTAALDPLSPLAEIFRTVSDEPVPDINISVGLVADLKTNQVYWGLNRDKRWPLASITKLASAAFAKSHMKETDSATVTRQALEEIGDASEAKFSPGEIYSVGDLIRAALLFSSNESAETLAISYGREKSLEGTNALVKEWGANETHFEDPTGLSVANQSTASDILRMARAVYEQYPDLLKITRTPKLTLTELGKKKKLTYQNINQFAGRADFIGGKTGYTEDAGENLVSVFAYEGRPIAIVVLGAEDRFAATEFLLQWFKETHTSR